jgi:hypothetical protein
MSIGTDEKAYDVAAPESAVAAPRTVTRVRVPVVDSADVISLRRWAQEHVATGQPVLIRHAPLLGRVAAGVPIDRLTGLFSLFGKVPDEDPHFAYNIKLLAKTIFRDDMLKLAELMGLRSDPAAEGLEFIGERLRYNRCGKAFHAGPGFHFKLLLMIKGAKRWDFVAPEYTPFMSSFEAQMCGLRSGFRDAADLDSLPPSLAHNLVPEVHTGVHEEGLVLLFSSQWWHSTHNLTAETCQVGSKFKNVRVYNDLIALRKWALEEEKAARGLPADYCSPKTEQNVIGRLMWSHSFLS